MMKLCSFVSDERIPCVALAADDSDFCPVHRDKDSISRVSKRGKPEPVICVKCHEEIAPGTMQRGTVDGPIHAEYVCEPSVSSSSSSSSGI